MLRFLRKQAVLCLVCACVIGAAAALGVTRATAASQATAARHPWYGLYECMGTPDVQMPAYFKLMRRGRYISALQLMGRALEGKTPGRWRIRGSKLTWVSGTYKRAGLYGVWYRPGSGGHPQGYIAMFSKQTHTSVLISCYPNLGG
jgi:hypothetical protein